MENLKELLNNFLSSIDSTIVNNIDSIIFINNEIINELKIFNFLDITSNNFIIIASALFYGILLFYLINYLFSHLFDTYSDPPYIFVIKSFFIITLMLNSIHICELVIYFMDIFSQSILNISTLFSNNSITLSLFIQQANSIIYPLDADFSYFSLNGLFKILTSFNFVIILILGSIRYITCKILIILSPFAFISLTNPKLYFIFYSWVKQFISTLLIQILISIILILSLTFNFYSNNIMSNITFFSITLLFIKYTVKLKQLLFHFSYNTK